MNNLKKISTIIIFCSILSVPFVLEAVTSDNTVTVKDVAGTSAENPLVPCGGVDSNGTAQPDCSIKHLNSIIGSGMELTFVFAGLIVAGMFMYAGFLMITAAGNTSQIQKAKEIFRRVVIGFLIMSLAYITVKSLLAKIDLDPAVKSIFDNLFK